MAALHGSGPRTEGLFHVEPGCPTTLHGAGPRVASVPASPLPLFGKVVVMEFVALLKFRPSVPAAERDAALMRRAAWQYPDGRQGDRRVLARCRGSTRSSPCSPRRRSTPLMELEFEWNDVFDISVLPGALAPTRGCGWAPRSSAACQRMQQARLTRGLP